MAERSLSHLNYGHAGQATFDLESRKWTFARHLEVTKLNQINCLDGVTPIPTEVIPAAKRDLKTTSYTRPTNVNLGRHASSHPELVPTSGLLSELLNISVATEAAASTYDPAIGDRFSIGSTTFEAKWDNPRRIAATATGPAGSILRFSLLHAERLGWARDRSAWLKGETLRDTESGYWNEEAAPIQQICFARSEDRNTLLAVRLPSKTVFFRVIYSQRHQFANQSPYYHIPPSIIHTQTILTLDLAQSGGSPHADVTFNPEFQLQFAVIDRSQTWSIWDVDNGRKGDTYSMSCLVRGKISEDSDLVGEDGWARVLWVGDVNTILVCNRRNLSIVDIKGGSSIHLPCPALFAEHSSDWHLDVKKHPIFKDRIFVLTSSTLYLMAVTTSSTALDATARRAGAHVLVSWNHYRGSEDFTLNISMPGLAEHPGQTDAERSVNGSAIETIVLLHSRLNDLIQTYVFCDYLADQLGLVSASGPTPLVLAMNGNEHITQLCIEPLQLQGNTKRDEFSRLQSGQRTRFLKIFAIRSDLSLHEVLVYTSSSLDHNQNGPRPKIESPSWSTIYRLRKDVRLMKDVQEMDDFLVPDGTPDIEIPVSRLEGNTPAMSLRLDLHTSQRIADYALLYDALSKKREAWETESETAKIPDLARRLEDIVINNDDHAILHIPLGTLMEFAGQEVEVSDVDEASTLLHQLMNTDDTSQPIEVQLVAPAHILALHGQSSPALSRLYDTILQHWVAPLPRNVSNRVRQHKERLARRVAAEIYLASRRIRISEARDLEMSSQRGQSQESAVSLPILHSRPLDSSSANTRRPPTSQQLPLLPSSIISSTQHSSLPISIPSQSSSLSLPSSDSISRLSKHLKMKDGFAGDTAVPPNIDQLLTHWHVGRDPRAYDWDATERALQVENLDEESQEQSERARRRKERKERKQRREDELSRTLPSSQPFVFAKPTVLPRSSPGPMPIDNSSQAPSQTFTPATHSGSGITGFGGANTFAVQSQVEPGRFGGRSEKQKKKKRIGGF